MRKCVIFTGGEIDKDFSFIDINEVKKSFVICADSGYIYAKKAGIEPDIIIGDYDSLGFIPENINEKFIFPKEKDDTDLMLAVKKALNRGYKQIDIYGAFGGRFDHMFSNVQALSFIAENRAVGNLISECERVTLLNPGDYEFKYKDNYSLSLFSYTDDVNGLTLKGTKYITDNITLSNHFPLGVSNIIIQENASISFKSGKLLVVQSKMINNISENA
ncbi:MAG: thiamine diphosphokinase [Ruminococcus sp.]|nr:thiamine diphosphokinase [Ruminococcus sp.]